MICPNCQREIPDDSVVCAYCAVNVSASQNQNADSGYAQQQNYQQQYDQQQYDQQQYNQQYGQQQYDPQYGQPYGGNYSQPPYGYGQQYVDPMVDNEISTGRTLGIVAIIAAFFVPIASWICGGIGISKLNRFIGAEGYIGEQARSAKKLCKIGIIISVVEVVIVVLAMIAFVIVGIFAAVAFSDEGVTSYYIPEMFSKLAMIFC